MEGKPCQAKEISHIQKITPLGPHTKEIAHNPDLYPELIIDFSHSGFIKPTKIFLIFFSRQ